MLPTFIASTRSAPIQAHTNSPTQGRASSVPSNPRNMNEVSRNRVRGSPATKSPRCGSLQPRAPSAVGGHRSLRRVKSRCRDAEDEALDYAVHDVVQRSTAACICDQKEPSCTPISTTKIDSRQRCPWHEDAPPAAASIMTRPETGRYDARDRSTASSPLRQAARSLSWADLGGHAEPALLANSSPATTGRARARVQRQRSTPSPTPTYLQRVVALQPEHHAATKGLTRG